MAKQGDGYGGGGAGGGESSNDSFTGASAGKGGYAAYIQFNNIKVANNKHVLINYNGTIYPTYHCQYYSDFKTSLTYQKVSMSIPGTTGRSYGGLKLSNSLEENKDIEINSSGVTGNFKSVTSKVVPSIGGANLNLVINTAKTDTTLDGYTSYNYPGQIWSGSATSGKLTGTLYAGNLIVFILQGGGGGGGGADNSWGLFNYASGGGGGGAGGACVGWFSTSSDRTFEITVGGGGTAGTSHKDEGSRSGGGSGGTTRVSIWGSTASGSGEHAYLAAGGGGGGGKSKGNSDHGSAGSGGGIDHSSNMNVTKTIKGGNGGKNGDGSVGDTSGSNSLTVSFDLLPVTITIDASQGKAGTVGSCDDKGGGGGASWLGDGGKY